MMYGHEVEPVRAPLYGIGGLLGVTLMVLLLAAFPEVRWFALFSLPLGIVMAAAMRAWRYLTDRRSRNIVWERDTRHFHWPQPIS
jgi:hypothetical protein